MKKTVNFDVDNTLITHKGKQKPEVVKLLKDFQKKGYQVAIWSRRGKTHAETTGKKLGITGVQYKSKNTPHKKPDVAVDDWENLGKKNIRV